MLQKYKILIALFALFLCSKSLAQVTEFQVTTYNNPAPGYLMFAPISNEEIGFIDNVGKVVLKKQMNIVRGGSETMELFGDKLTFHARDPFGTFMAFVAVDHDFQLLDTFSTTNGIPLDNHDFILLDDGSYFVMGTETRIVDLSELVPGGRKNAVVHGYVIQKISRTNNLLFEWNLFDYLNITDAVNAIDLTAADLDPWHCNSFDVDMDGNLLLSSRHLDEITKINVATGQIMWRMGGSQCKNNQFRFTNDTIAGFFGFSHQHDIRVLPNGNYLMFDNGNLKTIPYSRAVEYRVDEANRTVTKVWEYRHSPDIYTEAQGSSQRLPNGNTFINWSRCNSPVVFTEVTQSGNIALEMTYNGDRFYRIRKNVFKMSACERTINQKTNYIFNDGTETSNTAVRFNIDTLFGSGKLAIEKHNYDAHNITFNGSTPDAVYSGRWTLKNFNINRFSGKMKFMLGDISSFSNPDDLSVYCRATEGSGEFSSLETTYNLSDNSIEFRARSAGEYIIANRVTDPPDLILPLDSARDLETSVQFVWKHLPNAVTYTLQIADNADFFEPVKDTTLALGYVTIKSLQESKQYFWRVRANYQAASTGWSYYRTFSTLLSPPKLSVPASDEMAVSVNSALEWEPQLNASSYVVQIATDSLFKKIFKYDSVAENILFYKDLEYNLKYYWRVSSKSDLTRSGWSETGRFTTVLQTPVLMNPPSEEYDVDNEEIKFKWRKAPGAFSYRLLISETPLFSDSLFDFPSIADTFLTLKSKLQSWRYYYWKLIAYNKLNRSEWAPAMTFSTILGSPNLFLPENKAVNQRTYLDFCWEAVDSADAFVIQIDTDTLFDKALVDSLIVQKDEISVKGLKNDKEYFWRVKALNTGHESKWSEIWSFKTQSPGFIEMPKIIYPPDKSFKIPLKVVFRWDSVPLAVKYQFQLSADSSFDSPIIDKSNIAITASDEIDLFYNTTYFWRVKAFGAENQGDWSEISSFITLLMQPRLNLPAINSEKVSINTDFRWDIVDGASSYLLSLSEDEDFQTETSYETDKTMFKPTAPLKLDTYYYWRCKAKNEFNESDWSQRFSFKTDILNSVVNLNDNHSIILANSVFTNTLMIVCSKAFDKMTVEIYDLKGNCRISNYYEHLFNTTLLINASELSSGMYLISIREGSTTLLLNAFKID